MPTAEEIRRKKDRVVELARGEIGAHYVWGGYGNIPGDRPDPNPFPGSFGRRVRMWPNDDSGNRQDHGRTQPIMYAAYTEIGGRIYVCGGRCNRVVGVPHANMTDSMLRQAREVWLWPRPDDRIEASRTVWGENCDGSRHFDCVGFVNWCYWRAVGRAVQGSITQWRSTAFTTRIEFTALEPGDILCASHAGGDGNTSEHIGLYVGNGRVIHARSYRIGVEETPRVDGGTAWNYAGRPIPSLFR